MPGKPQVRRPQPDKTSSMSPRLHQVKNLRLMSLFEGKDSPPVVFGAFCAKLASVLKLRRIANADVV